MKVAAAVLALVASATAAHATVGVSLVEDTKVVGARKLRVDTWAEMDRASFEHFVFATVGPVDPLELTAGGSYGGGYGDDKSGFGSRGPILQAKVRALRGRDARPGLAFVAGAAAPYGSGGFPPPGWVGYVYASAGSQPVERLELQGNVGFTVAAGADRIIEALGGGGVTVRTTRDLKLFGEVYYRDSFGTRHGGAVQGGLRYGVSDHVKIDAGAGGGVWGAEKQPLWLALGARIETGTRW